MRNALTQLVVMGGLAVFVVALVTPTSADPGRHHWRPTWDDHKPHQAQRNQRQQKRAKTLFGSRHYRYFGDDPDRYFGVGPGSYECFGYDCIW